MAQSTYMYSFEIQNDDICVKFNCMNHSKRIRECIQNLQIDTEVEESLSKKQAFFGSSDCFVRFRFGHWESPDEGWINGNDDIKADAFFFENTDYPVRIIPREHSNTQNVILQRLLIGKEENLNVAAEDAIIFGTVNFHNQVGRTDFKIVYTVNGEERYLTFSTEVLSYKMDYRTDMRQVISDIEEEFSMLSYSLLKETYLTFKQSKNESTNLIWWQIFRDCFLKITYSIDYIVNRPKRRLKSDIRYERAERMPDILPELENEYAEFQNDPSHLYRIEEMFLSKDTIENRFLKYAIANILDRFKVVRKNILGIIRADNLDLRKQIVCMNDELDRLSNHPFFRGIGSFKGFTQDSLVMKQSHGYKEVYESWIILQCGYDLQEGIMQLEVKDISELYEIWCFIKIKNMVNHILKDKADVSIAGNQTEGAFIKNLIQGKASDVRFLEKSNSEIVLASVMYNATSDDEAIDEFDPSKQKTDIDDTTSKTTEQRPDIVLRLSKSKDSIQYTYLFDAKYRLNDTQIFGFDVPPVGAINQMHRYRDAIYYTKSDDQQLKKEIIGGYVLYPGNLSKNDYNRSYYKNSIDEVNIGAYPLKPGGHWHSGNDKILLDPTSAEDVLYEQIYDWINNDKPISKLLNLSIPQKGLNYIIDDVGTDSDMAFVGYVRKPIDEDSQEYKNHYDSFEKNTNPKFYYSGKQIQNDIDLRLVKYVFTNVPGNGYYRVKRIYSASRNELLGGKRKKDSSMRICFELGDFVPLGGQKVQFDMFPEGHNLHVPAGGKFLSLKHVKDMYKQYLDVSIR